MNQEKKRSSDGSRDKSSGAEDEQKDAAQTQSPKQPEKSPEHSQDEGKRMQTGFPEMKDPDGKTPAEQLQAGTSLSQTDRDLLATESSQPRPEDIADIASLPFTLKLPPSKNSKSSSFSGRRQELSSQDVRGYSYRNRSLRPNESPKELALSASLKAYLKRRLSAAALESPEAGTSGRAKWAGHELPEAETAANQEQVTRPAASKVRSLRLKCEDVRVPVRKHKAGASLYFLVDASASMGAQQRMSAVKGAIFNLLKEAYVKRDRVALIIFRDDKAETVLALSAGLNLARKALQNLATGGRTPLAAGLQTAYEQLRAERLKNPRARQYLIIVSDGRSNVPLYPLVPGQDRRSQIEEEIDTLCGQISKLKLNPLVLDTEEGWIQFGFAKDMAQKLHASYCKMPDFTSQQLQVAVEQLRAE